MALPSAVAVLAYDAAGAVDLEVGSPPSPLRQAAAPASPPSPMEFVVATPPRQQRVQWEAGAAAASEAGSAGSHRNDAEALEARLDAANAHIAQLSLQLGEARAQLAAAAELRDMAVKLAALEAKHAAQIEVTDLKGVIAGMEQDWA